MKKIDNSMSDFASYAISNIKKNKPNLDNKDIDDSIETYPLLENIISGPADLALKYFLKYNEDEVVKARHISDRLQDNLLSITQNVLKYGKVLVVYNDGNTVDQAPSSNFINFLTFTEFDKEYDEDLKRVVYRVTISEDNEENLREIHEDRLHVFEHNSIVKKLYLPVAMYSDSLSIPVKMMKRSQSDILKLEGLADSMRGCQGDAECIKVYEALMSKVQTIYDMMDNFSLVPLDSQEEIKQINKDLNSFDKIQNALMIYICSLSKIPATILFGKSPAGFSSGEHELQNYHDFIESSIQNKILKPIIELYHQRVGITHDILFAPLKTLTRLEMKEVDKLEADIVSKRVSSLNTLLMNLEDTPADQVILDYVFKGEPIEELQTIQEV